MLQYVIYIYAMIIVLFSIINALPLLQLVIVHLLWFFQAMLEILSLLYHALLLLLHAIVIQCEVIWEISTHSLLPFQVRRFFLCEFVVHPVWIWDFLIFKGFLVVLYFILEVILLILPSRSGLLLYHANMRYQFLFNRLSLIFLIPVPFLVQEVIPILPPVHLMRRFLAYLFPDVE